MSSENPLLKNWVPKVHCASARQALLDFQGIWYVEFSTALHYLKFYFVIKNLDWLCNHPAKNFIADSCFPGLGSVLKWRSGGKIFNFMALMGMPSLSISHCSRSDILYMPQKHHQMLQYCQYSGVTRRSLHQPFTYVLWKHDTHPWILIK